MRKKQNRGVTLVEVMVASLAAFVIFIGVMNFQYYCAAAARKADIRATAARLGLLLLEDWKTEGGSADYDPVSVFGPAGLDILDIGESDIAGPVGLDNEIIAGPCMITFGNTEYCVTLSYEDGVIDPIPQMLNVSVANRSISGELDKPISITTYENY